MMFLRSLESIKKVKEKKVVWGEVESNFYVIIFILIVFLCLLWSMLK